MENIVVVESSQLSKNYQKRYVVIDKNTREVLDDAQGYGYKTVHNAYASYSYKNRDKSKDKEKARKKKAIRNWFKEHKSFVRLMDDCAFEIAKGSWGPNDKFDAKLVKKLLKENNLETEFTAGELLREWRNF